MRAPVANPRFSNRTPQGAAPPSRREGLGREQPCGEASVGRPTLGYAVFRTSAIVLIA